ncbi:MAG: cytochrome c [Deltaproteobacteria bacterium]|nr:cytochrome c [Deltaproteobacteria bacterium]
MRINVLVARASLLILTGLALGALVVSAKTPAPAKSSAPAKSLAPALGDPERGRQAYLETCRFCHGVNPIEGGTIAPPIGGSSLALIQARVMEGGYPPGYKPKRATRNMPTFPHLKDDLPHIAAYLAQTK